MGRGSAGRVAQGLETEPQFFLSSGWVLAMAKGKVDANELICGKASGRVLIDG